MPKVKKPKTDCDHELLEELRKQRECLELAVRGTGVGIWDWNIKTSHVDFDERWAKMVGYKKKELKPTFKAWSKLVHPDDLGAAQVFIDDHFKGKTDQYIAEIRMKHKKGHWVWILTQGKVFEWDKKGKPLRMVGTHLDITERKEKEEELKKLSEVTIGRELRMIELKKEVNQLLQAAGEPVKYKVSL